jgi:hypothetical protein
MALSFAALGKCLFDLPPPPACTAARVVPTAVSLVI